MSEKLSIMDIQKEKQCLFQHFQLYLLESWCTIFLLAFMYVIAIQRLFSTASDFKMHLSKS